MRVGWLSDSQFELLPRAQDRTQKTTRARPTAPATRRSHPCDDKYYYSPLYVSKLFTCNLHRRTRATTYDDRAVRTAVDRRHNFRISIPTLHANPRATLFTYIKFTLSLYQPSPWLSHTCRHTPPHTVGRVVHADDRLTQGSVHAEADSTVRRWVKHCVPSESENRQRWRTCVHLDGGCAIRSPRGLTRARAYRWRAVRCSAPRSSRQTPSR